VSKFGWHLPNPEFLITMTLCSVKRLNYISRSGRYHGNPQLYQTVARPLRPQGINYVKREAFCFSRPSLLFASLELFSIPLNSGVLRST